MIPGSASRARRRTAVVMLLVPAALGCRAMSGPEEVVLDRLEWTAPNGQPGRQLLTEHFDIRVTVHDEMLEEYLPPFMETTFTAYTKLVEPAQEVSDRMVVYVFDTRLEWANFTRLFVPEQAHTLLHIQQGGYVDPGSKAAVTYDLGRDRTLSLLAHEGLHQYFAYYLPEPIPAWLNEGLACQFEAFDLDGPVPTFTPERDFLRRNHLREAMTTEHGLIPISELLRMHAGEAVVQTGQASRIFYAQVWSLVLLLREGTDRQYTKGFRSLLADAGTERLTRAISAYRAARPEAASFSDGEVVFRHYITEDLEGFMYDYEAFVEHLLN